MRAVSIFIFFVSLITHLHAQLSPELTEYYRQVNHAELSLIDSNYNAAIHFYEEAFDHKKNPFIEDRYNFAVCYAIDQKYDSCYKQLQFVVDKGTSIKIIQINPGLALFFSTKYGTNLIEYEIQHKKTYNAIYRSAIDSLTIMDQLFRKKEGSYSVYGDTIRAIDSMNVIAFNKLVEIYGFPSEELIGVDSSLSGHPQYQSIIIHQQYVRVGRFFNYSEMITNALQQGNIDAHAAAELIDKSAGSDQFGIFDAGLVKIVLDSTANASSNSSNPKSDYKNVPLGYFKISEEKEKMVNEKRINNGLETISEARQKTIFHLKDPRFLLPSGTISIFIISEKTDYEKAMDSIILLKSN